LPKGVTVALNGRQVEVKGPKGTLCREMPALVDMRVDGTSVTFTRQDESRQARASHGLARSLLKNLVIGVSEGYTRVMVIEGVGYRAEPEGKKLMFNVGYSKPVPFELPEGIKVEIGDRGAKLTFTGIDKDQLGQMCAKIRAIRPPEPYKGKGIRLVTEKIRRKVGKAGTS
jgi:large subunit ribosomal protein L6